MKKFYVSSVGELNPEELKTGRVSYRRLVERIIGKGIVLCNNVTEIDEFLWDNFNCAVDDDDEIFQWYLCNLTDWERENATEYGLIMTYSDVLDTDVLCVDHFGTSWDYVMTDVEWTTNFDECC